MKDPKCAVVSALPIECRGLLRSGRREVLLREGPLGVYSVELRDGVVLVGVVGVGQKRAEQGVRTIMSLYSPDRVILMGYGGGLNEVLEWTDVVMARCVLEYEEGHVADVAPEGLKPPWEAGVIRSLGGIRWVSGSFVCVSRLTPKAQIRDVLPERYQPAVVEMESAGVARAMRGSDCCWIGMRVVLDDLHMDVEPILERWMDENQRIRPFLVLRDLIRRPYCATVFPKLYLRAKVASWVLKWAALAVINAL